MLIMFSMLLDFIINFASNCKQMVNALVCVCALHNSAGTLTPAVPLRLDSHCFQRIL